MKLTPYVYSMTVFYSVHHTRLSHHIMIVVVASRGGGMNPRPKPSQQIESAVHIDPNNINKALVPDTELKNMEWS